VRQSHRAHRPTSYGIPFSSAARTSPDRPLGAFNSAASPFLLPLLLMLAAASAVAVATTTDDTTATGRLWAAVSPGPADRLRVTYRADATILLLRIPIYTRRFVGVGVMEWSASVERPPSGSRIMFLGASEPERARGLNRLGCIDEVIVFDEDRTPIEAAYVGFMTSSPEKDLKEAEKALGKRVIPLQAYSLIQGRIAAGTETVDRAHLLLSASSTYREIQSIWEDVRRELGSSGESGSSPQTQRTGPQERPTTFLHTVLEGVRRGTASFAARYRYSGRAYELRLEIKRDEGRGREFVKKGLCRNASGVLKVQGKTAPASSTKWESFTFWIESGPEVSLPLRIEFHPRSFLRIAFERDASMESLINPHGGHDTP